MRNGPLHWATVGEDFLETFETWLTLENSDNAESICRKWVEMLLKNWGTKVKKVKKKGSRGNKRPATDLGERQGNTARGNVPEIPNTAFTVVICRVLHGNNDPTSSMRFQASYTDVRHWEELIHFIKKDCSWKEPH
jgi:hypothetical protein